MELNPFGALSGCGACLFNCVLEGKMMYGLGATVHRHIRLNSVDFAILLESEKLFENMSI